jgi:hypothetical protein
MKPFGPYWHWLDPLVNEISVSDSCIKENNIANYWQCK